MRNRLISLVSALIATSHLTYAAMQVYVDQAGDFSPANPTNGMTVTWKAGTADAVTGLTYGSDAFASVQNAINAVDADGTIYIAAGTYLEGATLSISKNLTLQGDRFETTELSGNSNGNNGPDAGEYRVMDVVGSSTTVFINDLAIINGQGNVTGGTSVTNYQGGGINNQGNLTLTNSLVANNVVTVGGGIYNTGQLTLVRSILRDNRGGGGGIYLASGSANLSDTLVTDNFTFNSGGGIYLDSNTSMTLNNSIINNNSANTGAGIYSRSNVSLTLNSSAVSSNTANTEGGGIYAQSSLTLVANDSELIGNRATSGPGGGLYLGNNSNTTLNETTLSSNNAGGNGGGIYNDGSLSINDSLLTSNAGLNGGALFNETDGIYGNNGDPNATIIRSRITNNQARSFGGAVYNNSGGTYYDISEMRDENNHPIPDTGPLVSLTDTTVDTNRARGGGAFFNNGRVHIRKSTIANNTSTNDGGAIYNYEATYEYQNSGSGNIIRAELIINNSTLSGNQTSGNSLEGGAIMNRRGSVHIANTTITNNTATFGGGLSNEGIIEMANSLLLGNAVTGSAGGVNLLGPLNNLGGNIVNTPAGYTDAQVIGPLADNGGITRTHAIIAGGPAHNTGDDSLIPADATSDQRGATRIGGSSTDVGAYEYHTSQPEITSSNPAINSYTLTSGRVILLRANTNLRPGDGKIRVHSVSTGTVVPSSVAVFGNTVTITLGSIEGIEAMTRYYLEIPGNALYSHDGNSVPIRATNAFSYYSLPDTIYVDQAGDFLPNNPSDGATVTWTPVSGSPVTGLTFGLNAFSNIQDALDQVASGGTIHLASGVFNQGSPIQVDRSVSMIGQDPAETILSGEASYRVLHLSGSSPSIELENLTVRDGFAGATDTDYGGGLLNEGGLLSIKNLIFDGNTAATGGGIMNSAGTLQVYNSAFVGNEATYNGGAIANVGLTGAATATVVNASFSNNSTNSPPSEGPNLQGGGAIFNLEFDANVPALLTLINSTLSGNHSGNGIGGGLLSLSNFDTSISNTLIVGNSTNSGDSPETAILGSLEGSHNLLEIPSGYEVNDLISPFTVHGGPTPGFALMPGSPAIDAGSNALLPPDPLDLDGDSNLTETLPLDQLGLTRMRNDTVDLGAIEFASPPVIISSEPEIDSIGFAPSGALTFNFDQIILAGSGNITLHRSDNGAVVSATVLINGNTLIITPDSPLDEGTGYYVSFGSLSLSNEGLTAYFYQYEQFNFTTGVAVAYVDAAADFTPVNPTNGENVTWNGASGPVSGLTFGVNAFTSIQEAIDRVETNGTVYIATGTYAEGQEIDLSKSLTLQGDGSGQTILSGEDSYRVIFASGADTDATINDLSIANGFISGENEGGGAIRNETTLTLNRCSFSENVSRNAGGAIYNRTAMGHLTINDSTLTGNSASNEPVNAAGIGGAIMNSSAVLIINNSTISGNYARNDGGAINSQSAGSSVTITNSTIIDNVSDDFSGGVFRGGTAGNVIIRNSIVAGNTGRNSRDWDLSGTYILGGVNFIGATYGSNGFRDGTDLSFAAGQTLSDVIQTELADNGGPTLTHGLPEGSPLINTGNNAATLDAGLTTDQRGVARITGSTVDIGAIEATVIFVDDQAGDYTITNDQGGAGLDSGDTVTWNGSSLGAPVPNLTFGTDAFLSIKHGIAAAAPGTTIYVAQGTYSEGGVIEISQDISLRGDSASITTVDGNATHRVFQINAGSTVDIRGLTIYDGNDDGNGAGLNNAGDLTLTEVIFNQNSSGGSGGAIHNTGTLGVFRSTMWGNNAATDGGAVNNTGTAELNNTTLSTNYTQARGAGLSNTGSMVLNQSTVVLNNSPQEAGGLYALSGTLTINNSLIAGNTAPSNQEIMGNFTSLGVNFIGQPIGALGFRAGTDLSFASTSSALVNLIDLSLKDHGGATPTHALVDGSPAIDGGDTSTLPPVLQTDQRGSNYPRILGTSVDIGSIEFESAIIGAALTASRNNFELTLDYVIENLGNVDLEEVSLSDDLDAVLGGANYRVTTAPAFMTNPGTLTLNADFDGNIDTNLLVGSANTLVTGDVARIRVVLTVDTVTDQGSGFGLYSQQATVVARSANGPLTFDLTDHGTDPDPNGNGIANEAGENDPTTYSFADLFRTVDGTVWNDLDGNGAIGTSEPGLSGVSVFLDSNENGQLDTGEASAATNTDGNYSFSRIRIGDYTVVVDANTVPNGFVLTSANAEVPISLSVESDASDVNFGYQQQDASIRGDVWNDLNGDGVYDDSESGINGVTVYIDSNNNQQLDTGERSAITNASGIYALTGLASGTYTVRVDASTLPTGVGLTSANASYTRFLAAGENHTNNEFGYMTRPVAAFSADTLLGCAPASIAFTDASTDALSWSWDFGDGQSSTEQNPTHVYRMTGTYTVSLTVGKGPFEDTITQTDYIEINGYQTVYIDAPGDYLVTEDQGATGINIGDTVTWKAGTSDAISGLIYGYDALSSLQTAVDNLCPDGTAYIAAGTYQEGAAIVIDKGLKLIGDGPATTILDGATSYRIMDLPEDTGTVIIEGLAFTNGYIAPDSQDWLLGGGAIRSFAQRLNLYNTEFSGNSAELGAAIYVDGGQLTVYASTFVNNSSNYGSIYASDAFSFIFETVLNNNSAAIGGSAIAQVNGLMDISASSIFDNSISSLDVDLGQLPLAGGAVLSYSSGEEASSLYLTNVTLTGNSGPLAGALLLSNSSVDVMSSTIVENTATQTSLEGILPAGGIYNQNGNLDVMNSLIMGNTTQTDTPDLSGAFTSMGINFIGDPTGAVGFRTGLDLSFASTETTLGDLIETVLADNGGPTPTFALVSGSPAINAGIPVTEIYELIDTDQRGEPRIFGTTIDLGAYELQNTPPIITLLGDSSMTLEAGIDSFIDPGATAYDAEDEDITDDIVVGGDTVDVDSLGEYIITYNVTDSFGSPAPEVTRTVTVEDTTAPVITLNGAATMILQVNHASYTELGAEVTDAGDPNVQVVIGGDTVDTNTLGTYVITYNATDASENVASEVTRTVYVINPPALDVSTSVHIDRQTGLLVESVTLTNNNAVTIPAFRLYVGDLPDDVTVYNAAGSAIYFGTNSELPYLLHNQELATGQSVTLEVEFYRASLDTDFPRTYLLAILSQAEDELDVADSGIDVERVVTMDDGSILIEIGSTPGASYAIEYSGDLVNWTRIPQTVTATANRWQWIDNGAPQTPSHPSTVSSRFYRFVLISE